MGQDESCAEDEPDHGVAARVSRAVSHIWKNWSGIRKACPPREGFRSEALPLPLRFPNIGKSSVIFPSIGNLLGACFQTLEEFRAQRPFLIARLWPVADLAIINPAG